MVVRAGDAGAAANEDFEQANVGTRGGLDVGERRVDGCAVGQRGAGDPGGEHVFERRVVVETEVVELLFAIGLARNVAQADVEDLVPVAVERDGLLAERARMVELDDRVIAVLFAAGQELVVEQIEAAAPRLGIGGA